MLLFLCSADGINDGVWADVLQRKDYQAFRQERNQMARIRCFIKSQVKQEPVMKFG